MSEGTLASAVRELRPAAEQRPLVEHSLVQLTLVRFREFLRGAEAVFWVFVFPILLAAGLGIAFRNRPAEVLKIAAVTPELAHSLQREKLLEVQLLESGVAEQALRAGKVALLAVPGSRGAVLYRYDDTNPEGRAAHMLADRAIQRAAWGFDPAPTNEPPIRSTAAL